MEVTGITITLGNLIALAAFAIVMIWAGLKDLRGPKGRHERSR